MDWCDWSAFTNQLMGRDRQFRLGDVEGKKMCNNGRFVGASSCTGDDEIIKAERITEIAKSLDDDIDILRK